MAFVNYEDLSEDAFERIVVDICYHLLGCGVIPFSKGKDRGKDARYDGKAAHLSSPKGPYKGKFVIQAKHTTNPTSRISDSDFSGEADSSVVSQEIPKIRTLVNDKELDVYVLFTNRKIAGGAETNVISRIKKETGVKSVELFGVERMDLQIRNNREILTHLERYELPLVVTPDDLAEVILSMDKNKSLFSVKAEIDDLKREVFTDKNTLNRLTDDYALFITDNYLSYFHSVKTFLSLPENDNIVDRYEEAASEFQSEVARNRRKFENFDDVLDRIQRILIQRDPLLAKHKRLTRLIVLYMYWNCDMGSEVTHHATAK